MMAVGSSHSLTLSLSLTPHACILCNLDFRPCSFPGTEPARSRCCGLCSGLSVVSVSGRSAVCAQLSSPSRPP